MGRRRDGWLWTALACAALAGSAWAGEPRVGRYTTYEAGEFTVVTSRSESQARQFVGDLGKFRVLLEKMMRKQAKSTGVPTYLLVVSSADWRNYLEPHRGIAGWFQPGRFANYMVLDGESGGPYVLNVVFHEYTHYFLRSQFSGEYPPFFNEGLAELVAYAIFQKDGMAILQIPMDHIRQTREGKWIPFDRMLKIDFYSPEYQQHKLASDFYAQSWLTVHYGLVEDRQFGAQMINYITQLNKLVPQPDASRAAFGADLDAIDGTLHEYSRRNRMSSGGVNLGTLPEVTLGAGKPMSDNDTRAFIADLMIEMRAAPDRIRPLVDSLAKREPGAARPAVFAARLALLDEDGAAFEKAVSAAEAAFAPGDYAGRRELAAVLLTSALDTSPLNSRSTADSDRDLKRALKWFGDALTHNPDDLEALWGFGSTAARLDQDLDLGEQALLKARAQAPTNAEIAVALANLKGHQQKPDEMIPYLNDALRYAADLGTRRWALDTLNDTREFIAERDRVAAENRKRREAYDKQLAEYEKKYGKKKKQPK